MSTCEHRAGYLLGSCSLYYVILWLHSLGDPMIMPNCNSSHSAFSKLLCSICGQEELILNITGSSRKDGDQSCTFPIEAVVEIVFFGIDIPSTAGDLVTVKYSTTYKGNLPNLTPALCMHAFYQFCLKDSAQG
jgi:hypothetical protein